MFSVICVLLCWCLYDIVIILFYFVFCFTEKIKSWILKYSYVAEYAVFSVVVYSGKQIHMSVKSNYNKKHLKTH